MTFLVSKIHQSLQVDSLKHKEQLYFFGPTSNSLRIERYKFYNKFKFESPLNFKGVQTFLEKSNKFSKIPSSHYILEYEFILTYLYSNIGNSFTSVKRDLVYFIPKRAGHLSILLPLS
jgi:hypothetical protein